MSENLSKKPAMILYNSFYGYLEENIKAKFKLHNFQLLHIVSVLL
jgi:hypothetical protein